VIDELNQLRDVVKFIDQTYDGPPGVIPSEAARRMLKERADDIPW
jgi:hypothetical protein